MLHVERNGTFPSCPLMKIFAVDEATCFKALILKFQQGEDSLCIHHSITVKFGLLTFNIHAWVQAAAVWVWTVIWLWLVVVRSVIDGTCRDGWSNIFPSVGCHRWWNCWAAHYWCPAPGPTLAPASPHTTSAQCPLPCLQLTTRKYRARGRIVAVIVLLTLPCVRVPDC